MKDLMERFVDSLIIEIASGEQTLSGALFYLEIFKQEILLGKDEEDFQTPMPIEKCQLGLLMLANNLVESLSGNPVMGIEE